MNLFIDFETRSAVDIKSSGAEVYARDPSTDVLCMAYCFDDSEVKLWTPKDPLPKEIILAMGDPTVTFIAHNAPFEIAIWNYTMFWRYGAAPLSQTRFICTMAMAYAMSLPGALAEAAPAAGIEAQKDSSGHRVMLQLSQPRSEDGEKITWWSETDVPEKFEKLYAYCKQDVEVERQLFKRLLPLSPNEREIWILDQRINQRGVRVDLKAVDTALAIVESEKKRLDQKIREVTKDQVATCTAVGQLTTWLKFRGIENVKGVGKADVADLLALDNLPEDVRIALLLRQEAAKSSTKKLSSMKSRACSDGRIRGTLQYHGAGTGRWAGRGLQVQNFPRPKLSQEEIENIFEILGKVS